MPEYDQPQRGRSSGAKVCDQPEACAAADARAADDDAPRTAAERRAGVFGAGLPRGADDAAFFPAFSFLFIVLQPP
ncbi:MAG TPA: hypothetical protein VNS57_11760 [Steroidobacteraceae bacterium]|nr:hypothetical protein [Steroidobacteraceae bacterium]